MSELPQRHSYIVNVQFQRTGGVGCKSSPSAEQEPFNEVGVVKI